MKVSTRPLDNFAIPSKRANSYTQDYGLKDSGELLHSDMT
jgi:hypothetical protein